MDIVIFGLYRGYIGVMLGLCWGYIGVTVDVGFRVQDLGFKGSWV